MLGAAGRERSAARGLGGSSPGDAAATSARGALEAKYSHSDWLALAPKIMDPIRDRRSAALQAYLIAERDGGGQLIYGDAEALFDAFLIDVQMSSCEVTTRVVQAYAAVQLFVERCLMGLEEPGVVVDLTRDDTWTQWQWMKRYRIWEANREVFLYPENWLIESQRPNRTEIFQKLEQEVPSERQHGRPSRERRRELHRAARRAGSPLRHRHVQGPANGRRSRLGRTVGDPPRFYHRISSDRAWSGWEQIQLDIKAHHAVPALYRGRLCLFWLDV